MTAERTLSTRVVGGAIVVAYLAFIAWEGIAGTHAGALTQELANTGSIGIPSAAALWAAYRLRRNRRLASAWLWIGIGLTLTTGGYLIEIGYYFANGWTPFPSLADISFLGFYPTFLFGVLRFPTRRPARGDRVRLALDVATISLCAASVIWELVLAPTLTQSEPRLLTAAVSDAYPTADLLIVFGLIRLLVRGVSKDVKRCAQILGVGVLATILGDVMYDYAALHSGVINGSWSTMVYAVSDACYLGGAIMALYSSTTGEVVVTDEERSAPRRRSVVLLPYLAPVVLLTLQLHAALVGSLLSRVVLTVLSAVVLLLVTARQLTIQRDLSRTLELVTDQTQQLHYQALHDALTGLPNRALILDRVDGALARARRNGTAVGVMFIDLDGFKRINDTYGHATGDQLLTAVSLRLASTLRGSDTIGRLGGDEFVILLENDSADLGAERIADRVRDALAQPFTLGLRQDISVVARASIGIAVGLRSSADELLRDADVALYAAKDAGKDRYVLFAHEMQEAVQERLQLEMDLRAAVGTAQFVLQYQPTVDLRTGVVTGTETLLRWHHPVRGLVMPDSFIPLAEETGLIVAMGRDVLNAACLQTAAWNRSGRRLAVSVNVSSRQLDDDIDLVADVSHALNASGLDPSLLTLEITESVLVRDTEANAHRLRMLKHLGVRIAIDDFGTGYSSIAYLQSFTVDALKIDRTFVSAIGASPEADALVHTLVQLGLALGLETCAEGIEDEIQLQMLRDEQCDSGQGYLFARPLSPAALERFLETEYDALPAALG